MRSPDSRVSIARRRLARMITPWPQRGEMWCLDCRVNGGRSLILAGEAFDRHVTQHMDAGQDIGHMISGPPPWQRRARR